MKSSRKRIFAISFFVLALPFSLSIAGNNAKVIHVFVALCDNHYQGIVPVPPKLGNGADPENNLYWGALYGVKTFFKRSPDWDMVETARPAPPVLERCIFKHRRENVWLIADAYQGKEIRQTVIDFLEAAAGKSKGVVTVKTETQSVRLGMHGKSNLVVYVGHDGLMDFSLNTYPEKQDDRLRETIILACYSKS